MTSLEPVRPRSAAPAPTASFPDNLPPGWRKLLGAEKDKPYFRELTAFLKKEYASGKTIYPPRNLILRALQTVDYKDVKVVILGQDPYHGPDQAVGLCFAVSNGLRVKPPSLGNIFKEIAADLKVSMTGKSSELKGWTDQGVLLLNTVLTVRAGQAFSHRDKGWETFTDEVLKALNEREEPIVFLLWGAAAQKKAAFITNKKHFVLKAAHPSPLSAHNGFFGCAHFSKTNEILKKLGREPIEWTKP